MLSPSNAVFSSFSAVCCVLLGASICLCSHACSGRSAVFRIVIMAVLLPTTSRLIILSRSNIFRNLMIVGALLLHRLDRYDTDANIWPLVMCTCLASLITSISSDAAMISKSNHHFSRSASSHNQCLTIFLLTMTHSFFID